MRLFVEKVFDSFVLGTEPVYTDAMYNELLGTADELAIFAITRARCVDPPSTCEAPYIQHHWCPASDLGDRSRFRAASMVTRSRRTARGARSASTDCDA